MKMGAALRLVPLVVILILLDKTLSAEHCYDVKGRAVPFGDLYYDGDQCRTCKIPDKKRHTMALMAEKWRTLFKIFDQNHDGIITKDDFEVNKNNFIKVYKLQGVEADNVKATLDKFWHCVVLHTHKSQPIIKEGRFVARYKKAYKTHRSAAVKRMHECNDHLLHVIDRDHDGFLSFDELFEDFRAWNQGIENLVRGMFNLMGPNDDNLVPNENFNKLYTEFPFGKNKELFHDVKQVYAESGFPV